MAVTLPVPDTHEDDLIMCIPGVDWRKDPSRPSGSDRERRPDSGSVAHTLDLAERTDTAASAVSSLLGALRGRQRWLLIYDNAEDPRVLTNYLPGGKGHVLITSRNPNWYELATPVSVDVFDRQESLSLLRQWVARLSELDANLIAAALEDLPLGCSACSSNEGSRTGDDLTNPTLMANPVQLSDLIAAIKKARSDPLDQLCEALTAADHLGEVADHLIGHFVDQARRCGAPWTDIGRSMGVTKQAVRVQQRVAGRQLPGPR